jgi:hypothetical protein
VATAANSAVVVAGGGGGGVNFPSSSIQVLGGNAAGTVSANAVSGSMVGTVSIGDLPFCTSLSSTGTQLVAVVNTSTTNLSNPNLAFVPGEPVSIGGTSLAATNVYYYLSGVGNTLYLGPGANGIPSAGSIGGTPQLVPGGGWNGSTVIAQNRGGGWATPSNGGWPSVPAEYSNIAANPTALYPTGGSRFQGGNGASNGGSSASTHCTGGAGGGGWYGGGGGSTGGGTATSGGGGSNYANTQIATNITYGTLSVNTANTRVHGSITISW